MLTHKALVKLHNALGYPENNQGVCYGFTIRWLEASFLGEKARERFENRIELIATTPTETLIEAINQAKAKKGQDLTAEDFNMLEILSFYDSLALFQSPNQWASLTNKTYVAQAENELSFLASSEEIQKKGGLEKLYDASLILSEAGIKDYLDKLGQLIDKFADPGQPIGFILGDVGHAVALTYQQGSGWTYRNSNHDSHPDDLLKSTTESTQDVAVAIKEGFFKGNDSHLPFYVQMITTKDQKNHALLMELQAFKKMPPHLGTNEISKDLVNSIDAGLYIATRAGDLQAVSALVKAGANIDQSVYGDWPLYMAAQMGNIGIVRILIEKLLENGFDINQTDGRQSLSIAAENAHYVVVEELIKRGVSVIQIQPLYMAARNGHVEIVKLLTEKLLDNGIDINQAYINGETPLYAAAANGHLAVIEELIKRGAIVNQKSEYRQTPLYIAAKNGHIDVVKELIKKGALNQTFFGKSFLFIASENSDLKIVLSLLEAGVDPNHILDDDFTPLYVAAQNGDAALVSELIKKGANLDQTVGDMTPLYAAIQNGHPSVVEVLIKAGANLNYSFYGVTPLYEAVQNSDINLVKLLVSQERIDLSDPSILDIAEQNGDDEIIKILQEKIDLLRKAAENTPTLDSNLAGEIDQEVIISKNSQSSDGKFYTSGLTLFQLEKKPNDKNPLQTINKDELTTKGPS